jgi:hypothetical protein
LEQAISYICTTYSCSSGEAEEVVQSIIRRTQSAGLSNRAAQKTITIPGTSDHPGSREVEINPPEPKPADSEVNIKANPAANHEEEKKEVTTPIEDDAQVRQQRLVNTIKGLKVMVDELSKDMYGVGLDDEAQGKVLSKIIEAVSVQSAQQTADTVKQLASPLLGNS